MTIESAVLKKILLHRKTNHVNTYLSAY